MWGGPRGWSWRSLRGRTGRTSIVQPGCTKPTRWTRSVLTSLDANFIRLWGDLEGYAGAAWASGGGGAVEVAFAVED